MSALSPESVQNLARLALAEDVGAGDLTCNAAIPAEATARAVIVARERCVVAGLPLVTAVYAALEPHVEVVESVADGDEAAAGTTVCQLAGPARALLTGERTALNFLQRLSGIATQTRAFVQAIKSFRAHILDTRKTTPTLRLLEKYAVACGGGENHRFGLFDAMMIKDNHRVVLDRLGPQALGDAVRRARRAQPGVRVVIEADSLDQVEDALAAGADQVLLDNMTPDQLREAVALVDGRAKTEASGGVNLSTVAAIAATGVDYISVGALTHSVRAIDFSLEIEDR